MKRIIVLTLGVILLGAGISMAQDNASTDQSSVQLAEVGNQHCPVSGRQIGVMGPAFKVEYNGKIYNLCCAGCKSTFLSDPEKYSKIAENDAKNA